ncbi:hypothetical protein CY34DRAFT_477441 [Suillus luteus UH-Slu-Lm8-n1]|uniref:Uncharacterized protein n=1 Tax=Suillus luteus UH-Slu-Lm8-n1 TaxID=930992 RepID=A0A0D0AZ13_9AGAM|nr:hypothetical protein CY34DRAFT_477441 [Suillus luteus UH-Slu-Lm8-n1]
MSNQGPKPRSRSPLIQYKDSLSLKRWSRMRSCILLSSCRLETPMRLLCDSQHGHRPSCSQS